MRNDSLTSVSVVLASLLLGISLVLGGEIAGFRQGMLAAYGIDDPNQPSNIIVHGPNFFDLLTSKYFLSSICFCLYIFGCFIERKPLSKLICIGTLLVAAIQYVLMLEFKYDIDVSSVLLYHDLLSVSIKLDWFSIVCVFVLLIYQLSSVRALIAPNRD